ncbi:hypothetical protein J8C00_15515 [Chloracidobacterium sp. E]|nr:hypothetical protein [Chloracidobacterium aggregatum]QUV98909.1 hypothetical protein J8C00_15515 [Chloracidobacterium sp. E]
MRRIANLYLAFFKVNPLNDALHEPHRPVAEDVAVQGGNLPHLNFAGENFVGHRREQETVVAIDERNAHRARPGIVRQLEGGVEAGKATAQNQNVNRR